MKEAYGHIYRDDTEADECEGVRPFRTLWPVTKGKDVAQDEQAEIKVLQNDVDDVDTLEVERRIL